jgi:prepilin-type processing-associated H-X9-DG protein
MRDQLGTSRIRECPSFVFVPGTGFERSAGGYGYNASSLGSSIAAAEFQGVSMSIAELERRVVNVPAKLTQIRRPAEKIAFADTAIATPNLIEYSFVTPPFDTNGNPSSPTIHFRHEKTANIAWLDGHVSAERYEWTHPVNVYGAPNARFQLGFFGPRDNRLFTRE